MKYYNISDHSERLTFRQAVLKSMVNIGDLYMPERIPRLPDTFFRRFGNMSLSEMAVEISSAIMAEDVPQTVLEEIAENVFTFDIPLKPLDDDLYVLELFHGPTLAFKDIGARFMAVLFEYLNRDEDRELTILVATSGDTGSAVASAFYGRRGIRVIILFPSGKVSPIQEKQLTTMGGNITALEVEGTFDDCQLLVKKAFSDEDLNARCRLTSANSINFARLFPQSFYYFYAVSRLQDVDKPVMISVPSGNFGNLTAGLIAREMGLRVDSFIAATNLNRSVPDYLANGIFSPGDTLHTLTNAMDVGNPSNFPRILDLFGNDYNKIKSVIRGFWATDEETGEAMKELKERYGYTADPHGAVGYLGLKRLKGNGNQCIFLETAHPAKFQDIVERTTGESINLPGRLESLLSKSGDSIKVANSFSDLKALLF